MVRTQIQLPDALYRRAKHFGAEKEMSLAEMTRRGLELLLDRYPSAGKKSPRPWKFPTFKSGLKVELTKLREILAEEREKHALRGLNP